MITPQELRIGNLVYIPGTGQTLPITAINMDLGIIVNRSLRMLPFNELEPIELTEEWLLQFGFKKNSEYIVGAGICWYFKHPYYKYKLSESFRLMLLGIDLKHVHQLQNLYFALTGEELKIKES